MLLSLDPMTNCFRNVVLLASKASYKGIVLNLYEIHSKEKQWTLIFLIEISLVHSSEQKKP